MCILEGQHCHKNVNCTGTPMLYTTDFVPSSFDTRDHFDYNIASLIGIVINCSVSSNCNDHSNH